MRASGLGNASKSIRSRQTRATDFDARRRDRLSSCHFRTFGYLGMSDFSPKYRPMDVGEDAEASSPSIQNLPLELYPRISAFLDFVGDDLSNFCKSLEPNREVVDKIMGGNEDYLKHLVASFDTGTLPGTAKAIDRPRESAKILRWMESNPDWTDKCKGSSKELAMESFCTFGICISDFDKLDLHEHQPGVVSFRGYVGTDHTGDLPREGDILYVFAGLRVSGWSLEQVNTTLGEMETHWSGKMKFPFVFLRDANFIFRSPPVAIAMGLCPVIRHLVDNQIIGVNDRYTRTLSMFLMEPKARGASLLCLAAKRSPNISCFDYLISLPDIDLGHRDDHLGGSALHWCVRSSESFSLTALKMVLEHPRVPDINEMGGVGGSVLHLVCDRPQGQFEIRLAKLRLLLESGADPHVADVSPIKVLYRHATFSDQKTDEFKQMSTLLLRGKRKRCG